jgi:hypothetical protein
MNQIRHVFRLMVAVKNIKTIDLHSTPDSLTMHDTLATSHELLNNPFLATFKSLKVESGDFSSHKATIEFVTSTKSVANSEELIKHLHACAESLPTDGPVLMKDAKPFYKLWLDNLQSFDGFFNFVSQFTAIDDSNAKKLIANMSKAQKITEYIVDYMNAVIKTHEAVEDIKSKKKIYSLEEFKSHILN